MNSPTSLLVPLPEINRTEHSLFELDSSAVEKWLQALPRANIGETTRRLYQALTELSHVNCKGKERFEILEKIRPHVHFVASGLAQHFLNKPIVLPPKAEKIVLLADTLNSLLATGYCQAYVSMSQGSRLIKPKESMACCLHRALSEQSCVLLRTYQLYRSPPSGFWLNLHRIFQVALAAKLNKYRITDKSLGDSTLQQAYIRPLLLATSRTHQLPQRYIETLFRALRYWSSSVELQQKQLETCVFLLNPEEDAPSTYRELARAPSPGWLGLNTDLLQGGHSVLQNLIPAGKLTGTFPLSNTILAQLSTAWSSSTARAAERIPCNEAALITVGMNATHFFIGNQLAFDQFEIDSDDAELRTDPFAGNSGDSWGHNLSRDTRDFDPDTPGWQQKHHGMAIENIDYELPNRKKKAAVEKPYQYLRARILDRSATGYRIEWPESAESRIRTGEVIGVKTSDYESWRIAIVRWLRSDDSHQMGLEAIASAATPYSARLVHAGLPVDEYQRAMLLPENPSDHAPRVLLTSVASFDADQTVELVRPGHVMRIKLQELLDHSSSYKLFTYKALRQSVQQTKTKADTAPQREDGDEEFTRLWDIL